MKYFNSGALVAIASSLLQLTCTRSQSGQMIGDLSIDFIAPDVRNSMTCDQAGAYPLSEMTASLYVSGHAGNECPLQLTGAPGNTTFTGTCEQISLGSRGKDHVRYGAVLYEVPNPNGSFKKLLVAVVTNVIDVYVEDLQPGQTNAEFDFSTSPEIIDQLTFSDGCTDGLTQTELAAVEYVQTQLIVPAAFTLDLDDDNCPNIMELCKGGDSYTDASNTSACSTLTCSKL
jgi:hypothetical protein